MESKTLSKCSYDKGYCYQQLFSCRTCYEEQVKDKLRDSTEFKDLSKEKQDEFLANIPNGDFKSKYDIPPHGFCLACMLTCHNDHEVNELYSKLDFRCDCGNSSLPQSCQLFNDKDYSNTENRYNQTYYDLYCHCHQPHNQEIID
jgi:hypothetical protein